MFTEEIMSGTPVTLDPADTLLTAVEKFQQYDVRYLPVMRGTEYAGLITDRDLLELAVPDCEETRMRALAIRVGDIMHTDVALVSPDTGVRELVDVVLDSSFGVVPVVDPAGRLCGVVTARDVLRAARTMFDD